MLKKVKDYFKKTDNTRHVVDVLLSIIFILFFVVCLVNVSEDKRTACVCCLLFLYVVVMVVSGFLYRKISSHISITTDEDKLFGGSISLDMISKIKIPVVVFNESGNIIWHNKSFAQHAISYKIKGKSFIGDTIESVCGFDVNEFSSSNMTVGFDHECFGQSWQVSGSKAEVKNHVLYAAFFSDRTEVAELYKKLFDESVVIAYIMVDNLEELMQFVQEDYRTVAGKVDAVLREWSRTVNGIIKEYERERYIFIFKASYLEKFIEDKFDVLDRVRDIRIGDGNLPITISIGVSGTEGGFSDKEKTARLSLDMALQRGGDQAVVRGDSGLEFYGGHSKGVSKRTKVRARVVANALAVAISKSTNVIIMGHRNADFDSVGSCVGLARLATYCGVKVNIVINEHDPNVSKAIEHLRMLREYDDIFVNAVTAQDMLTSDSLVIVSDVNNQKQFESPDIAENAFNVIIIDHHRKTAEYKRNPLITYIEPSASSACELVAEILEQSIPSGCILKEEADIMFAGIILDTKQFSRNTHTRTFSAALYLRGEGADPADAQYFFKTELEDFRREAKFESNVVIYRSVVAISVNEAENGVISERIAAAKVADKLLTIEDIEASFAICKIGNTVHISARSAGNVNVQLIVERIGGGGRFDAAATQLTGVSAEEAKEMLTGAIDEYFENS